MGFWGGTTDSDDPRFGMAGALWKVEDQRFVHNRPDVLSWQTEVLEEDLDVVGRITVHLFASTTGTDSDWVAKLIDVYPEEYPEKPEMGGYQLMIADDVVRGKFRSSMENPEPLVPGKPTEFIIDLRTRNHRFREGHRVMVQVQSTWFPLIGRNPQTFTDIPNATADDYRAAEQRVYSSRDLPSRVVLPVLSRGE
jgi:putative CocE/NonD family hydrolase